MFLLKIARWGLHQGSCHARHPQQLHRPPFATGPPARWKDARPGVPGTSLPCCSGLENVHKKKSGAWLGCSWHCRCGLGVCRCCCEMGQGCSAIPEPRCVPCVTRSLCQRGAAAQPCFMALTLAGGSTCHLHHFQGYQSTSPRSSYGNRLISCFLSPPWVSVSGWDSPHAGNPTEAPAPGAAGLPEQM